ncbi:hypothetical protein EI94DRAFT_1703796 [Lactarius quietus]|nr:hypothetical protein EI94DRAFT_1703796 [Lactarius quietus]
MPLVTEPVSALPISELDLNNINGIDAGEVFPDGVSLSQVESALKYASSEVQGLTVYSGFGRAQNGVQERERVRVEVKMRPSASSASSDDFGGDDKTVSTSTRGDDDDQDMTRQHRVVNSPHAVSREGTQSMAHPASTVTRREMVDKTDRESVGWEREGENGRDIMGMKYVTLGGWEDRRIMLVPWAWQLGDEDDTIRHPMIRCGEYLESLTAHRKNTISSERQLEILDTVPPVATVGCHSRAADLTSELTQDA